MSNTFTPRCPQCGGSLPADAPAGLCPSCLMAMNLATQTVWMDPQADPHSPPKTPPPAPEEIAQFFPNLEVLECLGRGGMGVVYRARQKSLNRMVALKILAPERVRDAAFAQRFAVEAETLAKLNHPGIVTIYEFGAAAGNVPAATGTLYYFLMEFVDGVTLRQLLSHGRISPREALAIVPKICDALQYAHDRGVVHRDIKPENILLGREGQVKVADFGLAKLVSDAGRAGSPPPGNSEQPANSGTNGGSRPADALTEPGKVMGTPQYMAPEQSENPAEVDHRADIYSLGVVLYQMLTGELPTGKFEPPSRKIQMDVRIDEIVLRALEKNPELRYQQASVLKTQVETITSTSNGVVHPAASAAAGLPMTSLCYVSTPEYLRTFRGRFFNIYQGKGELRLDHEALSFRSGWWQAVTIPLSSISALAWGCYPSSAKPVPLPFMAITFTENGVSRTLLFTPVRTEFMSPLEANRIAAEWWPVLQEAIRARTGRALELQPAKIGTERFWVVKTYLLSTLMCTATFAVIPLILEQRLPNRWSELIWGPIVPLVTLAILLGLRWWRPPSAPTADSGGQSQGAQQTQPPSQPIDT